MTLLKLASTPAVLLVLAFTVVACSSDDEEATPTGAAAPATTLAPAVPPAATQEEWIDRLVNRFLIDMNENLRVVTSLSSPDVQLYLRTGNETTVDVLERRMEDLTGCSRKLARVGPPPPGSDSLGRVYDNFRRSCPHYERLAQSVLTGIPLMASRDADDVARGEAALAAASEPSRVGARYYAAAVEILQREGLLRAYQG